MAGEGTEEYLQEILDPIYRNLLFDERNQIDLTDPEAVYSFMLGALTSGLMEAPGNISSFANAATSDITNAMQRRADKNAAQQAAQHNVETEEYAYIDKTTGIPMVGTRTNIASEINASN